MLRDLVKKLNSDQHSRLEVLDQLVDIDQDLSEFEDLNWRVKQSYLPKIAGNYTFQNSDDDVGDLIDEIKSNASDLISDNQSGAIEEIDDYIAGILTLDSSGKEILQPDFSAEVDTGKNYEELCISCGQKGKFDFRTTQTSPYSKSYMARGLTGESTSDDWTPKLCLSCFLDQTLMRALVRSDKASISSMEDTIFLKVFPGRYLGTRQAKVLRDKMAEHQSVDGDAENYLENEKNYSKSTL